MSISGRVLRNCRCCGVLIDAPDEFCSDPTCIAYRTNRQQLTITSRDYASRRIVPRPGQVDYLCLVDLLEAIRHMIPHGINRVLDYGAGGSPYRFLFPESCTYHRADLEGSPGLDFEYGPSARLPEQLTPYDLVLSTQVLEHVEDVSLYLSECHRALIAGGTLLLTTHGMYREHGCPQDYWRWTAHGLAKQIGLAGFQVTRVLKLTTGPRCLINMADPWTPQLLRGVIHRAADRLFGRHRASTDPMQSLYVCLIVLAERN